jgi:hypothetical protein
LIECPGKELGDSEGVEATSVPKSESQFEDFNFESAVRRFSTSNLGTCCQYSASEPALLSPELGIEVWA